MVLDNFPKNPPYISSTEWPDISQAVLLPGMTATNEFPFSEISPGLFELLASGAVRFYVYGVVEYEDPRVKGSIHTTRICMFWTASKNSAPFVTCPEYNEAN
jgi:hypothetical protein